MAEVAAAITARLQRLRNLWDLSPNLVVVARAREHFLLSTPFPSP